MCTCLSLQIHEYLGLGLVTSVLGFGRNGKTFSKADVEVTENCEDTLFCFGTIFLPGFELLQTYFNDPRTVPCKTRMLLLKLFEFLLDKDKDETLRSIDREVTDKCDLAVRLAEHIFMRLSVSTSYTLDQRCPNSAKYQQCHCGCRTNVRSHYGDTSIGSSKVWHGCVDIVLDGDGVPVKVIEPEQPDPLGGELLDIETTSDLEDVDITSQLLAQTLVFSFVQKNQHPDYGNFLIPSIGVNSSNIIFYFYDSQHDILLKTMAFRFFEFAQSEEVSYVTILATWFVINYKYLCSGCTEEILQGKKANFFELAGSQLPVYKNELRMGGIQCDKKPRVYHFEPAHMTNPKLGKFPLDYFID